jgi:hypothetical protein
MTGNGTPTPAPRWARITLALVWACSSLAVGVLGWLLFAISDRREVGGAGIVLLVLAALAAVVAGAVAAARLAARTLTASLVLSAAFVVAGIAVAAFVAAGTDAFAADLLLIGGIPVVAGVVSGVLGLRARAVPGPVSPR